MQTGTLWLCPDGADSERTASKSRGPAPHQACRAELERARELVWPGSRARVKAVLGVGGWRELAGADSDRLCTLWAAGFARPAGCEAAAAGRWGACSGGEPLHQPASDP
jgi:hypothetical protein